MNRKANFGLLICFSLCISSATAQSSSTQTNAFLTATRNKAWVISKYLVDSNRVDKTSLFSNIVFRFNQLDSSKFLIEAPNSKNAIGYWMSQYNDNIVLSMPVILDSSINSNSNPYKEAVKLISGWPLQKVEIQSSLLKFKMNKPFESEAIIEFTKKD